MDGLDRFLWLLQVFQYLAIFYLLTFKSSISYFYTPFFPWLFSRKTITQLGLSRCRILKTTICQEWMVNQPGILDFDKNAGKLNFDWKHFVKILSYILKANQMFRFINELYVNMESMNQCNNFAWRFVICKWNHSNLKVLLSRCLTEL